MSFVKFGLCWLGPEPRLLGQVLIVLDGLASNAESFNEVPGDEVREQLVDLLEQRIRRCEPRPKLNYVLPWRGTPCCAETWMRR